MARAVRAEGTVNHVGLDRIVPEPEIRGVDRVFARHRRNLHISLHEQEFFPAWMQPKDMRAFADSQHERRLRSVYDVACRKLVAARLKQGRWSFGWEDRENRADRDVGVDVGGTVERVHVDREWRALVEGQGVFVLLRAHPGDGRALERLYHHVVGHEIELLLGVHEAGLIAAHSRHVACQRPLRYKPGYFDAGIGQVDDRFSNGAPAGIAARPFC